MDQWTVLGVPIWPQWLVTVLACGLFVEYLRLVLTTPAPISRVVITALLWIASTVMVFSLVRAVQAGRDSADD